ncbi:MAG: response regulator [Pirellulales bacterium]
MADELSYDATSLPQSTSNESVSSTFLAPELAEMEYVPQPRRVLVVEDEDFERDLLVRRLELLGLQVAQAASISEARSELTRERFDLAIMDAHLPDGSGLELCAETIDNASTADLPVIILSSLRDGDIVRRSRAAGGLFFLGKPYDPNVLLAVIENAVGM